MSLQTLRPLSTLLIILCANMLIAGNPSYVHWDMENCVSNINDGSNQSYNELIPHVFNSEGCTQLVMANPTLYRQTPTVNTHSCAPGVDGGTAMCINSYAGCFYKPGQLEALKFDVQVVPEPISGLGRLSALSFYELAPEQFTYVDGISGPNNYPTRYSLTVYKNGDQVFHQEDIQCTQEWTLEEFNFSNNPAFLVDVASTFSFELLPYCYIGNGYGVQAWDIDEIIVTSECGDGVTIPGNLTTYGGATAVDLCLNGGGNSSVSFLSTGTIAQQTTYIITDPAGTIISLPGAGPTFDFASAGAGVCYVYLVAHEGSLIGDDIGANIANLQGCFGVSNPVIVTRNMAQSGTISIDGVTEFQFCGDPTEFIANPTVTGNQGAFNYWILTDGANNVLSINAGPPYAFSGLVGTNYIYHLSTSDQSIVPGVGENLFSMNGCYGLSNAISFSVYNTSPSTISVNGQTTLDVCGESTSALDLTVTGGEGGVVYLITDLNGVILESQPTNTLNLSNVNLNECLIYVIRTAGNLQNFGIGQSVFDIEGCYSLSNPINVSKSDVSASSISTNGGTSVELCLNGSGPVMVDAQSTGGVGPNTTWVITDEQANILDLPAGNPPFDFAGASAGICILYEFHHEGSLDGAVVGANVGAITGCYGRSNGITIRRNNVTPGTISTTDGSGTFTICEGSNTDFSPTLAGGSGPQSQWLITDANNNLLTVQNSLPLNFSNVNQPLCYVYHLNSQGSVGLTIGEPVTELTGCFGLSNQILVDKTSVQAQTIDINGQTTIPVCLGNTNAVYAVTASGTLEGTTVLYLITDNAGNILETQTGTSFDFNNAGTGTCQIWQLVSTGGVTGATAGTNVSGIIGCYDLSNPVTIVRDNVTAGTISNSSQSICIDGQSSPISFSVSGAAGIQSQFVLVNTANEIIQVSTSPTFDFVQYPLGTYTVYHISSNGGLGGVSAGQNLSNVSGCFGLSNGVTITTSDIIAGAISSTLGSVITLCVGDGVSDPVDVSVTGNSGGTNQWLITDDFGNILETPNAPPFDFETAGIGTCYIYHLTNDGGVSGVSIGENISGFTGCFGLSNPIAVQRTSAVAGTLTGPTNEICLSDNQSTVVSYTITGAQGSNSQYVLVGSNNTIIQVSSSPTFDFVQHGEGSYTIYHVSSNGTVNGLIVGSSINTLTGCYGLSNGVPLTVAGISAGTISSPQGSTINLCNSTGAATVSVSVTGNTGANNTYVLTDLQGNILDITGSSSFDFSNTNYPSCLIWHLTYQDGISGATIGANANNLSGCFGLTNPITVNKANADAGLIILDDNTYAAEICTSDNESDVINVNLQGGAGTSTWLLADLSGNILDIPTGPPFDFSNYPSGVCQIYHLAHSGSISGVAIGSNTNNISGCFDLSNQIIVTKTGANGGTITSPQGNNIYVCVKDGVDDFVNVTVSGNFGANSQWILTDVGGNILELPASAPFNFENAGIGTCLIWHVGYENGIGGLTVGANANNLTGCFGLSNPITVNRTEADGGVISLTDGTTEATYCTSDGISDAFTVNLSGTIGTSTYVVTDVAGNILDITSVNSFDFEGSAGICQVWNLSYSGSLTGATIGANVSGLAGCYDLSNPITITKNGTLAGEISGPTGTTYYACVGDGDADVVDVTHTGYVGPFTQCVVTDVDGNILEVPTGNSIDFDGAGVGVCYIYCITYQFGLGGVDLGANIADLTGCFSVSNNITVIRSSSTGGALATTDGQTVVDLCLDNGATFSINVTLSGNSGENCAWVITDEDGYITDLPSGPPFVLTGSGTSSTCYIYNICYGDGLAGLAVDWPLTSLQGCYELSNPIEVNKNISNAGTITTADGSNITLCTSDGIPDVITVINSASYGQFTEYILTDSNGEILEVSQSNTFDFEGAPLGVCYIYFVAWHGPLDGDFVTSNISALAGCFDLSNRITVNRESILGGSLTTDSGLTSLVMCNGDGLGNPFNTAFSGNSSGYLESWVVTDAAGIILDFPAGPSFDFEGLSTLTCHLYRITYAPGLSGLVIGESKLDLDGCFGLSNPIEVHKNNVNGGALELATGGVALSVCSTDGIADPVEFIVTDQLGSTCDLVVTNTAGDILNITPTGNIIDFEGIDEANSLVYNVCYTEPINNYAVGFNTSKWSTCHALSNPVAITNTCFGPGELIDAPVTFAMYPNPASDVLNINIKSIPEGHGGFILIQNLVGQEIERVAIAPDQQVLTVNISDYESGAYMILMGSKKSQEIKRFIKVK